MGKQSKSKKADIFGKGKVTPIQIAFIVDRYLCDNNFSETRTMFRNEASSLIANSPINEAPKTLLTLGDMLNEYICLKEQKVMVEHERVRLEQEKQRVHLLLQGMQNVMNVYNSSAVTSTASLTSAVAPAVPQSKTSHGCPSGNPEHKWQNSSTTYPMPMFSNQSLQPGSCSTHVANSSTRKRNIICTNDAPAASKRSCIQPATKNANSQETTMQLKTVHPQNNEVATVPLSGLQSSYSPLNSVASGTVLEGSSVAKCLFKQPSIYTPSNSSVPNTPPQVKLSHTDKQVSPPEISDITNCNYSGTRDIASTRCTVISSKRVMVSPAKQMAYIERSHCISSSPVKEGSERAYKREHVRSRLDFDSSEPVSSDKPIVEETSTSESEKELDIFDIDFNLDSLGVNFSFSEMLSDFDLHTEDINFTGQLTTSSTKGTGSGSAHEIGVGTDENNQVLSEFSSTMTEVHSEKDINTNGVDSISTIKSITKCITILSPAKSSRSSQDCQNSSRE